ncbi:MAG: hypothetical protein K2H26_01035, partial [Ruminococcus sp.]|nr:hypothetical protein [Ruminococcus sp.]
MKKLFSAVTSLVMAATFVSSAFTSSIVVSAAGSVPAVQPNVSMGGVKGVTANKAASDAEIILDFINPDSDDGYWRIDPDDGVVYVDMHITGKDNTIKPTGFTIDFAVEGGFKFSFEKISPALAGVSMSVNGADQAISCGCPQPDGHGTPISADDNVMTMITLDVPDGIADGLYEITASNVYISRDEKAGNGPTYSVAVQPGYIAIGDVNPPPATTTSASQSVVTTTTTTTKGNDSATTSQTQATTVSSATTTTTTTYKPADGNAAWVIPEVHAKKGEKVTLDVIVNGASDLSVAGAQFKISTDDKFGKPSANGGPAYDSALKYNPDRNEYAFGQGQGNGTVAKDGAVILSVEYTVPTDITAGKYPVTWSELFVSDTNGLEITKNIETVNGAI